MAKRDLVRSSTNLGRVMDDEFGAFERDLKSNYSVRRRKHTSPRW